MYEDWANEYGDVFAVPAAMGKKRIVVADPKGITHVYGGDTFTYEQSPLARIFIAKLVRSTSYHAMCQTH